MNTLPIRMVYSRNENFLSFMSRIRQELNNCIMHQDYPFPLIREQLPNDYVGNYARVCQANFVFQRACEQQAAIFLGNCSNTFDLYGLTLQPFLYKNVFLSLILPYLLNKIIMVKYTGILSIIQIFLTTRLLKI